MRTRPHLSQKSINFHISIEKRAILCYNVINNNNLKDQKGRNQFQKSERQMAKGLKRMLALALCICMALPMLSLAGFAAGEELITDYNELMTAVQNAKDGDTLLVGDIDFSPLSPDVPNSMMCITVDKSLTIKGGKTDGASVLLNGAFVLSGSKLGGEKISVRLENIVFDGKADYDNLTEKDYEHPWSEAEQIYTYNASLKAQQALSFMGNVDAKLYGCEFKNYMHEYGPVIDIRYADYTGNEYVTMPDYSGCRLNLDFEDCRIEKNTALYDGGAIYIEANHNVFVSAKNCSFSYNRTPVGVFSRGGGAIWASGTSLSFEGCRFEKNVSNHVFSDSELSEYDTHKGGALCLEACNLKLIDTTVSENRSSVGGAISMTSTEADIDGCKFISNRAEPNATNPDGLVGPWSNMGMGGAIYIEGNSNDTITLINCEIKENSASNAYGGIYAFYVPFEDPSLPTYNIKMLLCDYIGNTADVTYDYSTVGDLLWMSHPGDMLANPHLTIFGSCVVDAIYETDFPKNDLPTEENGYNYFAPTSDESAKISIPAEKVRLLIGERYGDKISEFKVGSNYSETLYKEETSTEPPTEPPTEPTPTEPTPTEPNPTEPTPIEPTPTESGETPTTEAPADDISTGKSDGEDNGSFPWWILYIVAFAIIFGVAIPTAIRAGKRKEEKAAEQMPTATEPEQKTQIVMTRYDDAEIDRFISLVPETQLLTGRELEVLREILHGKKQSEVAYYLGIEVSTVKDFYKKIYTKLGVDNKNDLFIKANDVLKK